ncbi:MAG: hypothetical protein OHK0029_03370 [Armatimonadaceae bacterium]
MTPTPDANDDLPFFDLPLNLPHARKVAWRIRRLVENRTTGTNLRYLHLLETAEQLESLLEPYYADDYDPEPAEGEAVRQSAAALGRSLVEQIEQHQLGEDRLGQCVRNLFECLALGKEGMVLSLRAGENPNSLQRPG